MPNYSKPLAAEILADAIKIACECGCEPLALADISQDSALREKEIDFLVKKSDLVISIGGDGTLLHLAKHAIKYDKPVLGINAGRLGFLSAMESDNLGALKNVLNNGIFYQNRMLLNVQTVSSGLDELAVNEIVFMKGNLSRTVDIDVRDKEDDIASYRADGIIVATPTGSTAYAMAAGGPIIDPSLSVMSITPICAHTLYARTVVLPADKVLTVNAGADNSNDIYISVDGKESVPLLSTDKAIIRRSDKTLKLVVPENHSYFDILGTKIASRRTDS